MVFGKKKPVEEGPETVEFKDSPDLISEEELNTGELETYDEEIPGETEEPKEVDLEQRKVQLEKEREEVAKQIDILKNEVKKEEPAPGVVYQTLRVPMSMEELMREIYTDIQAIKQRLEELD